MYCDNQKQIEKEKSLIIEKLSLLGYTDVRCYFSSVGVNKFFTVRAECVPWHNSGLFGECSYECRQKSDHDSDLCALNSLLKKANDLEKLKMEAPKERMAKETKTLGEPLAYWPDDKSTNIVCDETYKVICTESWHPLQKFTPEVVIGEPDTFILRQLLKLIDMKPDELLSLLPTIEKGNVLFYQAMSDEAKKEFSEIKDFVIDDIICDDMAFAYDKLSTFVISFLGECLKKAEEKAKCQ